jgi:hypothetical protein
VTEEDAWSFLPPLETWEYIGLVLKWLQANIPYEIYLENNSSCIVYKGLIEEIAESPDDLPRAICEFAVRKGKR